MNSLKCLTQNLTTMKKFLFILLGFVLCCSISNAQYSVNKTKYDYRTYIYEVGDPYNPSVAGVVSFLVPGLGQMLSGEGGRGAAFLGGYIGCWVLYGVGAGQATVAMEDEYQGEGLGLMVVGILGVVAVDIWSIVDAVHVAKVNNLAWRDRNKTGYYMQLYALPVQAFNSTNIQVGLKITF